MSELAESDSAAIAAVDRRVRRLEAQLQALAEAVEVLARGLERGPMAEPEDFRPEKAARRARELLLLVESARRDG